ncbi:MAG: hypothetical protein Q7J35_17825 [Candidatus Methanoperedens sp.]|nr:hypothetical protein [Candidatus Methanoperedens sp.]
MTLELRRFLYLDSRGINSLHSQLSEFSEKERRDSEQKKKSTSGKGRLSLKIFSGILNATGETELTKTSDSETQTGKTSFKTEEQRLVEIETAISKIALLELKIVTVGKLAKISVESLPMFIKGKLPFTVKGSSDIDIVREINNAQFITFELDQSSLLEGFSLWPRILMGGSLSKFKDSQETGNGKWRIGLTSHLGIMLREFQIRPHNFGIFGQVQQTGSSLYIKPYAIWV